MMLAFTWGQMHDEIGLSSFGFEIQGGLALLIALWGENSAKWELLARKPDVIFRPNLLCRALS